MAGRKRKPTVLKLVQGTDRADRSNQREPKPTGDLKDPLEWLTQSQREGWEYAIQHSPKGLLKLLDRSALAVWVVAEDLHRQASERVAKHGMLTKAPITGMLIQSPFLPIVNKQAMIMLRAASELGFTPTARARIVMDAEPDADDPWAKLANDE